MSFKDQLQTKLAKGEVGEVIEILLRKDLKENLTGDNRGDLIGVSARFHGLVENEKGGKISQEDATIENTQIIRSLLKIIESLPDNVNVKGFDHHNSGRVYLRWDFDPLKNIAEEAEEIFVFSANSINLINNNKQFLEEKLKSGTLKKLRLLLLDIDSDGFSEWRKISDYNNPKSRFETTICWVKRMSAQIDQEIFALRLWKLILTYSALHLKLPEDEEILIIQFYTYKFTVESKPHIMISKKGNPREFDTFKKQIENAWINSEETELSSIDIDCGEETL